MEQLEINKRFAKFVVDANPRANSRIVFDGNAGVLICPQDGEYILLQLEYNDVGLATKNKCLAYVNFHDTHG